MCTTLCVASGVEVVTVYVVKLPQMIKIYNAGSVGGLSLTSFLLELMAVTCTMTYNIANHYPFR